MASDIDQIKSAAQAYKKWALQARQQYISLRLRQDVSVRALYARLVKSITKRLAIMPVQLRARHIKLVEQLIKEQSGVLTDELTAMLQGYIEQAVSAGTGYSKAVTLGLLEQAGVSAPGVTAMFARVNLQAVEAIWARTQGGLHLSDRIWQQGENLRTTMRDIIQESVAVGQDAVKTARMLEQYVKTGKKTLAKDYPNMLKRMGSRIPGDVCYEALRLARTEMTAAFGEGTIAAARVSPSYTGMRWIISRNHPLVDVCDEHANHDEGLGKGVYSPGNEPLYPAHPNCLTPDQLIITTNGKVNIQDIVIGENVLTGAGNWKTVSGLSKKYFNGKVLKVTTKTGKQIIITPEHRLATEKGWIEANQIKRGDKILTFF